MKLYNFEKEEKNWDEREEGLPTHFVRRHPRKFGLPKALQTTNFVCCLAFFVLVSLHKRACDAALNEKSLSTLLRGFVARTRFELVTSGL